MRVAEVMAAQMEWYGRAILLLSTAGHVVMVNFGLALFSLFILFIMQ
jgi:hypothetical protein